jgi:hypothetical protein
MGRYVPVISHRIYSVVIINTLFLINLIHFCFFFIFNDVLLIIKSSTNNSVINTYQTSIFKTCVLLVAYLTICYYNNYDRLITN